MSTGGCGSGPVLVGVALEGRRGGGCILHGLSVAANECSSEARIP